MSCSPSYSLVQCQPNLKFLTIFYKIHQYQISRKSVERAPHYSCGRTDTTKIIRICAFHDYAKAPKKNALCGDGVCPSVCDSVSVNTLFVGFS
jgi:hypothetical protein